MRVATYSLNVRLDRDEGSGEVLMQLAEQAIAASEGRVESRAAGSGSN
jgi:hypothetical protein